jgi:hypothetical protein
VRDNEIEILDALLFLHEEQKVSQTIVNQVKKLFQKDF